MWQSQTQAIIGCSIYRDGRGDRLHSYGLVVYEILTRPAQERQRGHLRFLCYSCTAQRSQYVAFVSRGYSAAPPTSVGAQRQACAACGRRSRASDSWAVGGSVMSRNVQLHCDLSVDSRQEAEMVQYFETVYRPAATKFEGYVDLRLLKLQSVLLGEAPKGLNYRFCITYTTEELRQKWIQSDVHQVVWPRLQSFLVSTSFDFLLFEVI